MQKENSKKEKKQTPSGGKTADPRGVKKAEPKKKKVEKENFAAPTEKKRAQVKRISAKPEAKKPEQKRVDKKSAPQLREGAKRRYASYKSGVAHFDEIEVVPEQKKKAPTHERGGKLKVISLGGLQEIGKNITVLEYGNDIIVVDCGMGFPDEDMPGVDLVLPDFSYLVSNAHKVRGVLVTHGHEDHIGGIPYLLRSINVPIYGTRLSLGILEGKLDEIRPPSEPELFGRRRKSRRFQGGVHSRQPLHCRRLRYRDQNSRGHGIPLG